MVTFPGARPPLSSLFPHLPSWGREGKGEREDGGLGLVVFFRFVSCPLFRLFRLFCLLLFWLLIFGFRCYFSVLVVCLFSLCVSFLFVFWLFVLIVCFCLFVLFILIILVFLFVYFGYFLFVCLLFLFWLFICLFVCFVCICIHVCIVLFVLLLCFLCFILFCLFLFCCCFVLCCCFLGNTPLFSPFPSRAAPRLNDSTICVSENAMTLVHFT